MTQSGWIAGALIAGFVLYLAANKRLQNYWSILVGGGTPTDTPATVTSGAGPGVALPAIPVVPLL